MTSAALGLLLERVSGGRTHSEVHKVTPTLVVRGTSGPAPGKAHRR